MAPKWGEIQRRRINKKTISNPHEDDNEEKDEEKRLK